MRNQAEGYVLAIQWILHYYYNGVCSWSWYYPHHYAPYVSDIRNFANLELKFDLGKPFLPYEQLLGVLPAGSKALLPAAHHSLMSSVDSPIIDFYPSDFQVFIFFLTTIRYSKDNLSQVYNFILSIFVDGQERQTAGMGSRCSNSLY